MTADIILKNIQCKNCSKTYEEVNPDQPPCCPVFWSMIAKQIRHLYK